MRATGRHAQRTKERERVGAHGTTSLLWTGACYLMSRPLIDFCSDVTRTHFLKRHVRWGAVSVRSHLSLSSERHSFRTRSCTSGREGRDFEIRDGHMLFCLCLYSGRDQQLLSSTEHRKFRQGFELTPRAHRESSELLHRRLRSCS